MKYFSDVLKQFTASQRLVVLFLLLFFTSGAFVLTQYFKFDDCRNLYEQNLKMQEDFIKISNILRDKRFENLKLQTDSAVLDSAMAESSPVDQEQIKTIDENQIKIESVLEIVNVYNKK